MKLGAWSSLGQEFVALNLRRHARAAIVGFHSQDQPRTAYVDVRGKRDFFGSVSTNSIWEPALTPVSSVK